MPELDSELPDDGLPDELSDDDDDDYLWTISLIEPAA